VFVEINLLTLKSVHKRIKSQSLDITDESTDHTQSHYLQTRSSDVRQNCTTSPAGWKSSEAHNAIKNWPIPMHNMNRHHITNVLL